MKKYSRMRKLSYKVGTNEEKIMETLINNINCAFRDYIREFKSISEVLESIEISLPNLDRAGEKKLSVKIVLKEQKEEE